MDVGRRTAGASRLRTPTAAVVSAARIVPRGSVLGGLAALKAEQRRVFEVRAERGAMLQHVAALVGPTAHEITRPPLLECPRRSKLFTGLRLQPPNSTSGVPQRAQPG